MLEEQTFSYTSGSGSNSGDIAQIHKPYTKVLDRFGKKKRRTFKDYLKMTEEIAHRVCIVCGKEYGQKPSPTEQITSGLCPECFKKRTGMSYEEARKRIK